MQGPHRIHTDSPPQTVLLCRTCFLLSLNGNCKLLFHHEAPSFHCDCQALHTSAISSTHLLSLEMLLPSALQFLQSPPSHPNRLFSEPHSCCLPCTTFAVGYTRSSFQCACLVIPPLLNLDVPCPGYRVPSGKKGAVPACLPPLLLQDSSHQAHL